MKIDTTVIEHNALKLITECAENSFDEKQSVDAINYIMGIIDMANALEEVLKC